MQSGLINLVSLSRFYDLHSYRFDDDGVLPRNLAKDRVNIHARLTKLDYKVDKLLKFKPEIKNSWNNTQLRL
jgi:hypothetical protein